MLNKQLTVNKAPCTPRDATWEGIGLSRAAHRSVSFSMDPLARGPIRIAFYVRLAALKTHHVFATTDRAAKNLMHGQHKVSSIEIRAVFAT